MKVQVLALSRTNCARGVVLGLNDSWWYWMLVGGPAVGEEIM